MGTKCPPGANRVKCCCFCYGGGLSLEICFLAKSSASIISVLGDLNAPMTAERVKIFPPELG